jgi:hypothetical protein
MVRATIATSALNTARSLGRSLGCELEVTLNNQHVKTRMTKPVSTSRRVWDDELYAKGQVYYDGYCNPIQPVVRPNKELDERDELRVLYTEADGSVDADALQETFDSVHVEMMSSPRFHEHMNNHMVSEFVTPDAKWNKMLYAILGVGATVIFFGVVQVLVAAGVI